MIIAPKITLVDLDNTLFDGVKFLKSLFPHISSFLNLNSRSKITPKDIKNIYESHINSKGMFSFAAFSNCLSLKFDRSQNDILMHIQSMDLNNLLMPGAIEFSSGLVKDADWLIVYTAGALRTQSQKIERTDLNQSLNSPKIYHLSLLKQNKYSLLREGLSRLSRGKKLSPLVLVDTQKSGLEDLIALFSDLKPDLTLIDDKPTIIERGIKIAQELKVPLLPIWIKYGRHALGKEAVSGAVIASGLVNKENEILRIKRGVELFQNPPAFRK